MAHKRRAWHGCEFAFGGRCDECFNGVTAVVTTDSVIIAGQLGESPFLRALSWRTYRSEYTLLVRRATHRSSTFHG